LNAIASPVSILAAVPPLVAWMSVALGAVLSSVRAARVAEVVACPSVSVAVARKS
jgi:hypothetical protein